MDKPSAFVSGGVMRIVDIISALVGLLVLSPLFVVVALAIRLTSPGPVFYLATRVGKDGRLFKVFKFRSMVSGADRQGPGITTAHDARITPVGRFLRKTKVDELPQLINVLAGDMALVGPRPEDARYVACYTDEQRRVLSVRPGITSAASLQYRDEESLLSGDDWQKTYIEQILPSKLAIELEYLDRRTFFSDMSLIVRTVLAMAR